MNKEEMPKSTESNSITGSINEANIEVAKNEQLREKIMKKGRELGYTDEEIEKLLEGDITLSEITPKDKNKGFDSLFENDEEKQKADNKKKDVVVKKVKKDIEQTFDEEKKKKDNVDIDAKLKALGLDGDKLKNNAQWQKFSKAEKLLMIEQASQDTLSRVKEIGEKRFEEKNTIKFSKKMSEWKPLSLGKKMWHKVGKSFWISKEEKEVLNEVENGKMKPDEKVLETLIKRQSELGLNVVEKDGKAFIGFVKGSENLSKEQKTIVDKYNLTANNFAKMPDSWKNEKSAKSTAGKDSHQKFEETQREYEKEKALLIESKVKQYEASGMKKDSAKEKAMMDVKDLDFQIAMLQFTNTNPDAMEELNKIRNESSWGRLVNNENIWRAGYMAAGYGARTAFHSTIGFLTAPITAGIIGGVRGRRKANENVNKAFNEGRKEETFLERKEAGKKGLFDNKNKDQNALSYLLQGEKVNTKEVAAFIDADSQKQRIENLINKINNTKDNKEKLSLIQQIEARLRYIELKQEQGLINYGAENPTAKNYELFKAMGVAYAVSTTIDNIGIPLTREMNEDLRERDTLLASVMARNEAAFGENIASHKNAEMLRGAMVGVGFAALGGLIREWMQGDETEHVIEIAKGTPIIKPIETIIHHSSVEAVADHGQGAISTLRELQHNLKAEYPDLSKAPESVKHILNTDAHKLAQEYGMYKPGDDAESAFLKSGEKFTVDENGNVKFENNLLEKGSEIKVNNTYEGKMFDSDHSGEKVIDESNTNTPETYPERIPEEIAGMPTIEGYVEEHPAPGLPFNGEDSMSAGADENQALFNVPGDVGQATKEVLKHSLSPEEIADRAFMAPVNAAYKENLSHLFPKDEIKDWQAVSQSSANKFIEAGKEENLKDTYDPLFRHLKKLQRITHLHPRESTITAPSESIDSYMARALKEAAKIGKLNRVKI